MFHGESTCAISTILMPPILARFSSPGGQPHTPQRDHTNNIKTLNRWIIMEYNFLEPQHPFRVSRAPASLHTFSVLFHKKRESNIDEPDFQRRAIGHQWEQWREPPGDKQLHLSHEKILQMGRTIFFFYKGLYSITD